MDAMQLRRPGEPLIHTQMPDPEPGRGEVRVRVSACGVCRTDLHVVDGELPGPKLPVIPGHEIVGRIEAVGTGVEALRIGTRVGIPWLGSTCGVCAYCTRDQENLCDRPLFTGYTRDGGYATHVVADARFVFPLPSDGDDVATAPLLCAGLIGWRSLRIAGEGRKLGLYGFGAAAHIIAQVARWQGRDVFAFTRPGDVAGQDFARKLGAGWAGASDAPPPEPLDCAIIFAPVGALVPAALKAVRKGGRVVCAGIHMSDIPSFPYRLLWEERQLVSVANLTRQDGKEFFDIASQAGIATETVRYPLAQANEALGDLRSGRLQGAAVWSPEQPKSAVAQPGPNSRRGIQVAIDGTWIRIAVISTIAATNGIVPANTSLMLPSRRTAWMT
jgi:propanol-preferring alcohol dehydrogenase